MNHIRKGIQKPGISTVEDIARVRKEAFERLAAAKTVSEVAVLERAFVGRRGALRALFGDLKAIPPGSRPAFARTIQSAIADIERVAVERRTALGESGARRDAMFDVTMPPMRVPRGHLHPLTIIERRVEKIFSSMGFSVVEGPEVETEWYNFDALNIPPDHPARDLWNTIWLKSLIGADTNADQRRQRIRKNPHSDLRQSALLLRTHTSPVQIRYMQTHEPPFRIIAPGRVYRFEATDASHEIQFHQVEGLMVGTSVSVANFKFIVNAFFERFFARPVVTRLRASYFPFTEPSFEVDLRCLVCNGQGCATCGRSGWLEMGGAGMVHPAVFRAAGYVPGETQGFAFGFGLERFAMMKYKIPDIRLFNSGDIRLSQQF